jgi:hypothetical protein
MMQLLPIFLFADLETTQDRPIFFWRPMLMFFLVSLSFDGGFDFGVFVMDNVDV